MITKAAPPKIAIDEEFANLMPPPTQDEAERLEANLKEFGCLQDLIVWDIGVKYVLLDGHTRYRLCKQNDIPYKITRLTFASRDEARDWAINYQLGRRNLPEERRTFLLGKLRAASKPEPHRPTTGDRTPQNKDSTVPPLSIGQVAEQHGVSEDTVRRAEKFTHAVEAIGEIAPELKERILAGGLAAQRDIKALAKLPAAEIKAVAKQVAKGVEGAVAAAVHAREPGDDTDLIKAEAAKRRNSGKEKISPKDRKEAARAFGVILRFVSKAGKRNECEAHLDAIRLIVEGRE